MVVLSTLPTQAGAPDTTLIISSLKICAAYAVAVLQAEQMRLKTTTLEAMTKVKLVAMMEPVVTARLVHALILKTSMLTENLLETLTVTTAMSTLTIQTGADNTTLKISTLEICAAHAMAVPQVDLMKVKPTKVMKVKPTKVMKVMMAALEVMEKVTLVMTPQEEKENVLMTT
jgi:hypothetical protein